MLTTTQESNVFLNDDVRQRRWRLGFRIAPLRICYRLGYQRLQDFQVDVGQASDVDTYLPSPVLSQFGQQDVTTFEARRRVNNQLTSAHSKPSESGIAFVTTGVLVM